ncbi:MAG: hypothetical protein WAL16_09115 [Streptosporangiaceae bacterium]
MDETQIDWVLNDNQAGWVIRMQAKTGKGDDLFETVTRLFKLMAAPPHWVVCRAGDDPDTLWSLEIFKDDETLEHLEDDSEHDKVREQVLALLAEPPMRVGVHPYAAGWPGLGYRGAGAGEAGAVVPVIPRSRTV